MSVFENAYGIITNAHKSDPESEYYSTTATDEVIKFTKKNNSKVEKVNDWVIIADGHDLKVRMVLLDADGNVTVESDTIFINAGDSWGSGRVTVNGIKVLGAAGQKIKYICNYYK